MILFAIGLTVLIGVIALAIDVGFLLAERRQNQAAVDAAAMSAAVAVLDKRSEADVQVAGKSYGAQNAGVDQDDVRVEWPAPGTGALSGVEYVRVTITKDVRKFFLGAIYGGNWQVTNTAVAGIQGVPKPYALVALKCPGIALNGGIQIRIDGEGSAMSNCDITNSGNSSLFAVGGTIDANGTIEKNDSWAAPGGFNEGMRKAPDPLAEAEPPPKGVAQSAPDCLSEDICHMPSGYYNNLGTITVKNTVCLTGGTYYLDGNTKLNFQNSSSLLTNQSPPCPSPGGGVLLYVAGNASINLGNSSMHLSTSYPAADPMPNPPPADGPCLPEDEPYPDAPCGMVLWIANGSPFDAGGSGAATFDGVIYAPDSAVSLAGTPGSHGLQVIVGSLTLSGDAAFQINYREYVKADTPAVFLVE